MEIKQLEEFLAGIEEFHRAAGLHAVGMLALAWAQDESKPTFDFHQTFPLSLVKIPPQNLDQAMPEGWTFEALSLTFENLKVAAEAGEPLESVALPEGVSTEHMSAAWGALKLYNDSGAVLRRNTQHNKQTARLRIEERGLAEVLVVLDEEYRIISGLPICWALLEMDSYAAVPAVILHGAPQDAGWHHTHKEALAWGNTLWKKGEIQEVLESSSPREQEFFREFGFHAVPDRIELRGSRNTMKILGDLIAKQLGSKSKLDPAQMLYVEALRKAITIMRQAELDPERDPGEAKKLKRHLDDEARALAKGNKILERKGSWKSLGNGLFEHWAMSNYVFRLVEQEPMEAADVTPEVQSYRMPLNQFQILARTHFGVSEEESAILYASDSAEEFETRLKRYVLTAPVVAANSPEAPSVEERERQAQRLSLWKGAL